MLVLRRKKEERVRLSVAGVVIWVQVVEIDRNTVRLGFAAPAEVAIWREEVLPARGGVKGTS